MSKNRGAWISRRGQANVEAAIDQVIDRQPQVGEQIQQVADELIEDSPYQARQPFSDESVEDLAQGMREAGFQGVLIVRPHSEPLKRRRGLFQLVYGHRRRAAWRHVCTERSEPCLLPVVVREVRDERMLTIGAQENLQRQDLDPVEEAQIVAWHERAFFDKNQAEIGAMLGKSSDWVSVRSRIHKLPEPLKDRLRQRPRAISQILELSALWIQRPAAALELADRVVHENLTLDTIRALVRGYARPERRGQPVSSSTADRLGTAPSLPEITSQVEHSAVSSDCEEGYERRGAATNEPVRNTCAAAAVAAEHPPALQPPADDSRDALAALSPHSNVADLLLLQEAAAALATIASRTDELPNDQSTMCVLDQAEQAIVSVRRALVRRSLPLSHRASGQSYQLVGADIREVHGLLHEHRPTVVTLHPPKDSDMALQLVICFLPMGSASGGLPDTHVGDLFVAVAGGRSGTLSLGDQVPIEWVESRLGLTRVEAAIIAAFIGDLANA